MVLELCGWLKICEPVVQYIAQDCVTKSMCRVPSTFIQSIYTTLSYPTLTVVSEDETALIIGTETTMGHWDNLHLPQSCTNYISSTRQLLNVKKQIVLT